MKLYHATTYGNKITEIDAIRITPQSYYTDGYKGKEQRNALEGSRFKCFQYKKQAVEWLRCRVKQRVQTSKEILANYERELQQFTEKYPEDETE